MRRAHIPVAAGMALALLAAACGGPRSAKPTSAAPGAEANTPGDIPDNQAFVTYSAPSGGYSLKVPEGWARTEAGGAVTFTDKLNSIRVETADAGSAPTVESATRDELPAIRATTPGFTGGSVTAVTRAAGSGVLITYGADSIPEPVTGRVIRLDVERYELWRAGRQAVITLSGPKGADNVDPWRTVTDSLRWQ